MIRFISGKPGAGKSYYATMLVLEKIKETKRQIVTNLALDVKEICSQLHAEHGHTFDAAERIRILTPEETGTFWLYFGNGLELDPEKRVEFKQRDGRKVQHIDYTPRAEFATSNEEDGGAVCYFIDEAHEFFNAREWRDIGKDCLHFLSQHRKLSDDVWFITQHVRNVDTQLRRLAAEFAYVRNHIKEKLPGVGGVFKSVQQIGVSFYGEEENKTSLMIDHKFITPNWETIGKCYDTAAGVGIGGHKADKGEKAKGLPVWMGIAALVAAGLCLWWITTPAQARPKPLQSLSQNITPIPTAIASVATNITHTAAALVAAKKEQVKIKLHGIGAGKAFFSDGSVVDLAKDRRFGGYTRDGHKISGVRLGGVEWILGEERSFEL